ncbi:MAG: poly-gamma-glutamate biosynthesis protein PgsC [Gammaproteobacteria bacterium]
MIDLLALSIGIGLIVGLIFAELFGLVAGGMVVSGYLALNLTQPMTILLTLLSGLATFGVIRALSTVLIIFGRRRIALTVLIAFLIGMLVQRVFASYEVVTLFGETYKVIGYIIPGLIAISIDRQGMIETFTMALTSAVIVRLVLVILVGSTLPA